MADPVKVIKNLLGAEQELADFIQNGPSGGLPGHVRDGYRHRCNEFANLPGWARALTGVAGGSINRICDPYWGDNGWDGPETADPPFTGGQCPVAYNVSGTYVQSCGAGEGTVRGWTSNGSVLGPVSGAIALAPNGTSWQLVNSEGQPNRQLTSTANGSTVIFAPRTGVPCSLLSAAAQVASASSAPVVTSVTRVDGQPDNCGDLPTEPGPGPNPPPDPGPLPGPEPTDNPDPDNPIPFLPIPPFDDPTFGPQPITGPNDDPPAAPGPASGGDGLPGDPNAIAPEAAEVAGGDDGEEIDFGEPPEGRIWVGCIVETTTDVRIGNIPGTGPQSSVWPTTRANVALVYGSRLGKMERINSRFFDLFRPNTALEVTGCFLQVQIGSTSKVFPVSALICPENPCEE